MDSQIDAPGKQGSTGDNAFDFFEDATDVPWHTRGLTRGVDYQTSPESYADIMN